MVKQKKSLPKSLQNFSKKYGPWAVVTGATDGIGGAIAVRLAELGFNLVLVARRESLLNTLATHLNAEHEINTLVIAVDLGLSEGVNRLISETAEVPVGLLVAAAGFGTSGPFVNGALSNELSMVDVNCRAVAALAHAFGNRFAAQHKGGMILFGSLVGFQGVPWSANYAATKAYVQSLAEGLHHELAPLGVDVLSCAPGPVATGFAKRAQMQMGKSLKPEALVDETLRALGLKTTVRSGWLSKLLGWSLAMLPRQIRVLLMARIMKGMSLD